MLTIALATFFKTVSAQKVWSKTGNVSPNREKSTFYLAVLYVFCSYLWVMLTWTERQIYRPPRVSLKLRRFLEATASILGNTVERWLPKRWQKVYNSFDIYLVQELLPFPNSIVGKITLLATSFKHCVTDQCFILWLCLQVFPP